MEDNRFATHMNWDYSKCHKKCCHEMEKYSSRFSHNCKDCICHQLRKLEVPTRLDIFLSGCSSFLGVTFIAFDPQNCCATFLETTSIILTIDCNKIDAIRRIA